ncbi:MAG TPA: molybdopterin-dependent oxidoreductase [Bryobacteraceae bacterium]|nr:molybdopterin-dependent oxidoreductase [Bryobacteraceae bacterium]
MRPTVVLLLASLGFAAGPALRIEGTVGRDGVAKPALELTLADLAAMQRSSVGGRTPHGEMHQFEGVLMSEILRRAGLPQGEDVRGPMLARYIVVSGRDGYRAVFSPPEFDPAFTNNRAILANKMDGQPLSDHDGPLRLVLWGEKRETRWVRMVERIEVLAAPDGR